LASLSLPMTVPRVRSDLLMNDPSLRRSSCPVADSLPARSIRFYIQQRAVKKVSFARVSERRDLRASTSLRLRRATCSYSQSSAYQLVSSLGLHPPNQTQTHHNKDGMTPRTSLVPVRRACSPPRVSLMQQAQDLGRHADGPFLEPLDRTIFSYNLEGFGVRCARGREEEVAKLLVVDFEERDAEGEGTGGILLQAGKSERQFAS
jgi:hypothetical protein